MATDHHYLGFDLSTQQLKGIIVHSNLKKLHEAKVDFDADLGHYGIEKGVLTNPAEGEIFAPVAMFIEAVDLVLRRLREDGADFGKIKGVSGAGMQHGTVFWSAQAETVLGSLDAAKSLKEQLVGEGEGLREGRVFSHPYSPNWQDASTQRQCDAFDDCMGGPEELARLTGSKAHHRFSGPQIMRFREKYPDRYNETARISLVSSFLASVFLGKVAPIDISDVTGMNLWHIEKGRWHDDLIALAAGGKEHAAELKAKLGSVPEDGGASFGPISPYFVSRYGFPKDCAIIPFTGDNPATILALPLRASDAIVSLGTSTTFLMSTPRYQPDPAYHFMNHPTTAGLYMFMLCYKNGGLAREHVRDAINRATGATDPKAWDAFNAATTSTPVLGQAKPDQDPMRLGLFFPRPEIVPNVREGVWRFLYNSHTGGLERVEASEGKEQKGEGAWPLPTADARAIVESQFLSLRLRSRGLVTPQDELPAQPRRIYLVGGGSANPAIAELAGQVLGGAEGVFKLDIGGNACALGAAYKAVWGVERAAGERFEELVESRWDEEGFVRKVADGYRPGVWERYGESLKGFEAVERRALEERGERVLEERDKKREAGAALGEKKQD